ncbi:uncharacterized protein K441DRAFT_666275 [Cenococcum geophilum 1.58]|uniref:uncharacterized protein n=1 Tax=Cenococcum geophilum 1.58 TaxID=794803 RepID=UPI003590254D|nr:hypothetical protein K441DRAFT_666275 [Cenococcum geophilum 1.58]
MVGGSDLGRQNVFPKAFRALHIPGRPIASTNVHDAATAPAVLGLPSVKAIVTASYAVATAARFKDDDMALETNFAAIRALASVAKEFQNHSAPIARMAVVIVLKMISKQLLTRV